MSNHQQRMTFGLIVGTRGFFPDHLAKSGREEMLTVLDRAGIDVVTLRPEQSKHGAVETHEEAKRCAALFRATSRSFTGRTPRPARWLHQCLIR